MNHESKPGPSPLRSPAADSLSAIGWTSAAVPAPRVEVDGSGGWQWNVSRVWTTVGDFDAPVFMAGTMWAFIGVDGVGTILRGTEQHTLRPQEMLVVPATTPLRTTSTAPWARIIWRFETSLLRQPQFDGTLGIVHRLSEAHWGLITALTGTIAAAPFSVWETGATYVNYALASTIASAVADNAGPVHAQYIKDRTGLYRQAIRVIDERFLDPSFTVPEIARTLAISVSYLHKVFAEVGTRPAHELEWRRARRAHSLLSSVATPTLAVLEDVAGRSGFTSVSRMRSTMRRQSWRMDGSAGRSAPTA